MILKIDVTNKNIVLTGKFPQDSAHVGAREFIPRDVIIKLLETAGAHVQPAVNAETNLLLTGDTSKLTRKLQKAAAAGIEIRPYHEVFEHINYEDVGIASAGAAPTAT